MRHEMSCFSKRTRHLSPSSQNPIAAVLLQPSFSIGVLFIFHKALNRGVWIFLLRALAWLIPKFLVRWFVAATDVFRCVLVDLFIVARVEIPNHERYFLSQLQSRGFLRSCLNAISNISNQDGGLSLDSLQSRGHVPMRLNLLYY
ncbi:hypothetical protein P8452_42150 [Trifolium repens]|nr:hypothetical protein P8452_42150 [Trifolium repens]